MVNARAFTPRSTRSKRAFVPSTLIVVVIVVVALGGGAVLLLNQYSHFHYYQHQHYGGDTTTSNTFDQFRQDTIVRHSATASSSSTCDPGIVYRKAGLRPLEQRIELGLLLESKGFDRGAEIGVRDGGNALNILTSWTSCQYFALVDLWLHQENYIDNANVVQEEQDKLFATTKEKMQPWQAKTEYFRMLSVQAAAIIPDQSLDFVYLDARHDYCGCMEDIRAYWPKLRPGGILAGHDFMTNKEVQRVTPNQDFGVCLDGTKHEGAVRGAVEAFADEMGLVVSVCYKEFFGWQTWIMQKPTRPECVVV